ncbi:MAG TPA: hypothetical protein VJ870_09745 [Amycolatopsis sp.]|nr:hypothetical protein [Amycolatopsis sp.]
MNEPPGNPLSIELTVSHRRLFWHSADEDDYPERWDASADVSLPKAYADADRHVADIRFLIADLTGERNLLDSLGPGEWAVEFLAETVLDRAGRLRPELGAAISTGPPRMAILRHVVVAERWRGRGLAAGLIAGALRILAPAARLAVCRVSAADFARTHPDRMSAELAGVRAGLMLERIGFRRWHGAHVIDLRNPDLRDARLESLDQWWPRAGDDQR